MSDAGSSSAHCTLSLDYADLTIGIFCVAGLSNPVRVQCCRRSDIEAVRHLYPMEQESAFALGLYARNRTG